jgi:2-iminobutanoate/2-iminopropanoate deaminase
LKAHAIYAMKSVVSGGLPFSPSRVVGDWIFLSGQGGFDPGTGKLVSGDIAAETEQTFRNIEALLEAAGASLDDVVSCLVHLVDLGDFAAFNAAYERQFSAPLPVRTTVRADLVAGMRVEITVVAKRR